MSFVVTGINIKWHRISELFLMYCLDYDLGIHILKLLNITSIHFFKIISYLRFRSRQF